MAEWIFETQNLCFGSKISYENIKICKEKVTFIVGRSGAGKSTLLKLFNATVSPSNGEVYYCGVPISEMDTLALRRQVILVGQSVFLFDGTIQKNFEKFYEQREMMPPLKEKILEYLHICLVPFGPEKKCSEMSGGERQRVFLALYLSFMPKVLLLDEPTSALDKSSGKTVIKNILEFCAKEKITVVAVSHDALLTEEFADDIIVIGKEEEEQ